jgi:hypothetical protein
MSSKPLADTLVQIQDAPTPKDALPLVLIHDGGGTVFNYWTIGPLHREVYGIADPAFENGANWEGWEGGIPQMAELYCEMIRKHLKKGGILLGGKSFSDPCSTTAIGLQL